MLGRKNHLSLVIFHFSFAQVEVTSRKPLAVLYRSLADSICGYLYLRYLMQLG